MKICMVTNKYFPLVGGAETQAYQLSEKLLKRGDSVFTVTRRFNNKLKKKEYVGNVLVCRLFPCWGNWPVAAYLAAINVCVFLIFKKRNYQIIHIHGTQIFPLMASLAGKILGKKTVVKIATAGDITRQLNLPIMGILRRKLIEYADAIIGMTPEIREELRIHGIYPDKIFSISNGVDIEKFAPLASASFKNKQRANLSLPLDKKLVIFTGRLIKRKGVDILLNAWREAISKCDNIHLVLLGQGLYGPPSMEIRLKRYIQKYQIYSTVTFRGDVNNVCEYLPVSDVFVFPSRKEGLPNALLEAMSCGLPVVATRIGGTSDVIENKINGILVDPEDAKGISREIIKLVRNEEYACRLGKRARTKMVKDYSMDKITQEYFDLYRKMGITNG